MNQSNYGVFIIATLLLNQFLLKPAVCKNDDCYGFMVSICGNPRLERKIFYISPQPKGRGILVLVRILSAQPIVCAPSSEPIMGGFWSNLYGFIIGIKLLVSDDIHPIFKVTGDNVKFLPKIACLHPYSWTNWWILPKLRCIVWLGWLNYLKKKKKKNDDHDPIFEVTVWPSRQDSNPNSSYWPTLHGYIIGREERRH